MIKISIVTAVFNARQGLEKTIESIRQQSFKNIEFIVVDGESVDGTVDLIKSSDIVSHCIVEPDDGLYFAMDKGREISTGDFVFFMNAGDEFCDDSVLQKVVNRIEEIGMRDVNYFGNVLIRNGVYTWRIGHPGVGNSHGMARNRITVHHQGIFFPRIFYSANRYDTSFRIAAEKDFICRALMAVDSKYLDVDILRSELAGFGISRFKTLAGTAACYREMRKVEEKHPEFYRNPRHAVLFAKCYGKYALCKVGGMKVMTSLLGLRAKVYRRMGRNL